MIDLSSEELALVRAILVKFVPQVEVRVFGSRIEGCAKPYSDLDLVLFGDRSLDLHTLGILQEAFQESDLKYRVDLVDYHQISDSFRAVIDKHFEVIQQKTGNESDKITKA